MQKLIVAVALLLLLSNLSFAKKTIVHPSYEFRTTGTLEISGIQIKKNETRLWVHCMFLPGWWMKFGKQTFIRDAASGEKLFIKSIEKGELDKEIYMPASGDSTMVLTFPALSKASRFIDFGENEKTLIYGLSLKPKKRTPVRTDTIPESVEKWINTELSKARKKAPVDYSSPEFFSHDTARLVGYIKGYDRRAGFSTGIIYASNDLTNEDFPTVITIHEDGRFETNIPMCYPKHTYMLFEKVGIDFYIEPGQCLSMIINWEEFLTADRLRNERYNFKEIRFGGPLAEVNRDLKSVSLKRPDYNALEKYVKTLTPADFKAMQMQYWKDCEQQLEQQLKEKKLTSKAEKILRNELMTENAAYLYDYIMDREDQARADSTNKILKIAETGDYYQFMQKLPFDDPSLLVCYGFSPFINRFEYSKPFSGSFKIPATSSRMKSFPEYLFTELHLKPSEDDRKFVKQAKEAVLSMGQNLTNEEREKIMKELNEKGAVFYSRYKKYSDSYKNKYVKKQEGLSELTWATRSWQYKDSILKADFRLQPGLVYQIVKLRSLKFTFQQVKDKDAARTYLTSFENGISHPFLAEEAEHVFYQKYPSIQKTAYDLPPGKATDIFRKIIEPHKGKTLIVDFWAIFCGPCISTIRHFKESRRKYKDNGSFDFIFITSDKESPLDKYEEFVKDQELTNTYRISSDDYLFLRELFKFNGIPKYILIGKDGKVVSEDFEMHNFEREVEKLVAK